MERRVRGNSHARVWSGGKSRGCLKGLPITIARSIQQQQRAKTSRQSLKRSSASQSRKPPILMCLKKAGQLGGATTMRWEDDGAWRGECMTRNTGESPNAARRISVVADFGGDTAGEILFERKSVSGHPAESGTAGKDLPDLLKTVLLMQSGSGGAVTEEEREP